MSLLRMNVVTKALLTVLLLALQIYGAAVQDGVSTFVERDGINRLRYDHPRTGCTLDIVKNSGICETTPGVNQYSGYLSVGNNMSMFFWFFEARHKPKTAPLVLWLNGGPGCSSMVGLFQENGPCIFTDGGQSTPSHNPHSFNEYANMLYVDQPIGVGFSYGTENVNSTASAAPYVWNLIQAFFDLFPRYENRDFGLFTESYGGHYGPDFAYHFEAQNNLIRRGRLRGEKINLVALGINNGWYDMAIQDRSFIDYSYENSYYPIINKTKHDAWIHDFENECLPVLETCTSMTGQMEECIAGQNVCNEVDSRYFDDEFTGFNQYDIRQRGSGPFFPPMAETPYLQNPAIRRAIGAKGTYEECAVDTNLGFYNTADSLRPVLSELSSVVRSGVQTLMWAGDADAVCDWMGNLEAANSVEYSGHHKFKNKAVSNYTVNGVVKGTFKTVGKLSWLRVFDAGHEVPAFQPELALQVFIQTMKKKGIYST